MVLLGAVANPDVKATFGAESELLDATRSAVEDRHGKDLVESWLASGAAHDPSWAVDHAVAVLT